jgi:hypothetical protein
MEPRASEMKEGKGIDDTEFAVKFAPGCDANGWTAMRTINDSGDDLSILIS